jgi:hypothetical protein
MVAKIRETDLTVFSPNWAQYILELEDHRRSLRVPVESNAMKTLVHVSSELGDVYSENRKDSDEVLEIFRDFETDLIESAPGIISELEVNDL